MQQAINDFLIRIPEDIRSVVWYTFIALLIGITCILIGLYEWLQLRSAKKSTICSLISLGSYVVIIAFALMMEKLTNNIVLLSGVTYYVPYLTCSAFLLSRYCRRSFLEMVDIVSLSYLPARAINIVGCTVTGCCQGYPAEWGLYSAVLEVNVIPVQLFESATIIVIWCILNRLYWLNCKYQKGKCAVYSLIFFGALNVFTDIFTFIQPKLIFMISVEGIFAFITTCCGLITLYFIDRKNCLQ